MADGLASVPTDGLIARGLVGGILEALEALPASLACGTTTISTGAAIFSGMVMTAAFFAVAVALVAAGAAVAVAPMMPARRIFLLPFHLFFTQLAVRPGSWVEIWDHLQKAKGENNIEMRGGMVWVRNEHNLHH